MRILIMTAILGLPLMALGQTAEPQQTQAQGQTKETQATAPAKGKKMRIRALFPRPLFAEPAECAVRAIRISFRCCLALPAVSLILFAPLRLAQCFPRSFTLITRTAPCLRQLP